MKRFRRQMRSRYVYIFSFHEQILVFEKFFMTKKPLFALLSVVETKSIFTIVWQFQSRKLVQKFYIDADT